MEKLPNQLAAYRADHARRDRGITVQYVQGRERILGRGTARYHAGRLLDSLDGIREALAVLREVHNGRRPL